MLNVCMFVFGTQIYEKNPKFGGCWYENRYPGVACDIPSREFLRSAKRVIFTVDSCLRGLFVFFRSQSRLDS